MQDTFVYIRKKGDTTGITRKQVGKWALTDKNSIPQGYELDPDYKGDYQPTTDPVSEVKKRKEKVAVVVEPSKTVQEPESQQEVDEEIVLTNPLEDENQLTENEEEAIETKKAKVVKKAKRAYKKRQAA